MTVRRSTLTLAMALFAMACGPTERPEGIRLWSDDFAIRVSSVPSPPRALEQIQYKVVVRDKETGEPIEVGEGRIFATNQDRHSIDNGLTKGKELGTYYTTLFFANSGPWAMGVQFRRDSTQRLQRTTDWMQDVLTATPPGQ